MKTFLKPLYVAPMISAFAVACGGEVQGNGVNATETRALGSFDRVRILQEVSARIAIDPLTTGEVKLTGDANLLPIISTEISGDELVIDLRGDSRGIDTMVGLVIEAGTRSLVSAELEHGSSLEIDGLDADDFSLSAVGGSIADFSGRAKLVDIEMAGGSIARLTNLEADEAHLQIAGAAEVDVCVKHRLEGDAAGNSEVRYTCNPREVDVDTSGGSNVSRL
jgi:hypothetical protein